MDHRAINDTGKMKNVQDEPTHKLIFDRILGHKHDLGEGSGQWRQLTK